MTGASDLKRWEPGELREGALMAVESGSYIAKSIGDRDFIPAGAILAGHDPDSPTRLLAWVPVEALSKSVEERAGYRLREMDHDQCDK